MLIVALSAFLFGAVVSDVLSHRLPNHYLLLGLSLAVALQVSSAGWLGVMNSGAGLLAGFAVFLPFYLRQGMAAGDVKLMAVVGAFLGGNAALWASAYSLMAGSILGLIYLLYRGHLGRFVVRYWAIFALRSHIPAEDDDAARHRFPYALAIAAGAMASLYWKPI